MVRHTHISKMSRYHPFESVVDTGSSLNVMHKNTIIKLNPESTFMKINLMVVKALDGLRRMVIGEVDLPMMVEPHMFMNTFQVMDISP